MNSKIHIYWKAWIIIIIILLVILVLNFVLQIETLFPIIGNAKDWLAIWTTLIAVIVGGYLNYKYNKRLSELERQRRLDEKKIIEQEKKYNELKKIISENISIFNFETYKNMLYQISSTTSNINLIRDLSSFQQKIHDSQDTLDIFYNKDYRELDEIIYKTILYRIVTVYSQINASFISYLSAIDDGVFKSINNINDIFPISPDGGKLILSVKKIEGRDLISKKKAEIIKILETHKSESDEMMQTLKEASHRLLTFEQNKTRKLQIEKHANAPS